MTFIADLHIHSHYSIATSRDLVPEALWQWGQLKGIRLLGTGDLTHPGWLAELEAKLVPAEPGLFTLRPALRDRPVPSSCRSELSFLLSGEVSCIYRKGGRTRKVHCLVYLPDFGAARRLNARLARIGSVASDGRPILKLDAKDLLSLTLEAAPNGLFVPAHAWTPHFSVFGAATGFQSLEECFEELACEVRAIETGLSSDPPMNRRISALDGITLVSNSDAHSPAKLGREATLFDTAVSYEGIYRGIREGDGVVSTIEFFPEQGKYHADGHRPCQVRLNGQETREHGYRCPGCGAKVTVGVAHRVELLADRSEAEARAASSYQSLVPLAELIAGVLGIGSGSKKVGRIYFELLERLGSEFTVLREAPLEEIARAATPELARAIGSMRLGQVEIEPGYDGEYGKIRVR